MDGRADNAITIWSIDWRGIAPDQADRLATTLSGAERQRAASFARPDDKARFILARGILRQVSGAELGADGAELSLAETDRGKPYWQGEAAPLGFNLSHSGDWIFLAMAKGRDVGVDVQHMRPDLDIGGIARLSLHAEEAVLLAGMPDEAARRRAFFDLWVLREAAIKATGDGMFAHGGDLNMLPLEVPEAWMARRFGGTNLLLSALPAAPDYRAALAIAAPPDTVPPPVLMFGRGDLPMGPSER